MKCFSWMPSVESGGWVAGPGSYVKLCPLLSKYSTTVHTAQVGFSFQCWCNMLSFPTRRCWHTSSVHCKRDAVDSLRYTFASFFFHCAVLFFLLYFYVLYSHCLLFIHLIYFLILTDNNKTMRCYQKLFCNLYKFV